MPTPPKSPGDRNVLRLEIRGCGHITSFKNTKMITHSRLITDPKKQAKMDSYIRAIELGLYSAFRISESATLTGCTPASWTRSNVPLDDSWKWIPQGSFEVIEVPPGHEGADIYIEKIDDVADVLAEL